MALRGIILFIIVNLAYFYFERPVLAWGFTDWSALLLLWGGVLMVVTGMLLLGRYRQCLSGKIIDFLRRSNPRIFGQQLNVVDIANYQQDNRRAGLYKKGFVLGGVFLLVGLVNWLVLPVLTSAPIFYSHSYRALLGDVKESQFTADIEPINLSQIRIIDEETARKLAEKKIGEVPALGSEIQLGQLVLQKVQGKLYYVGPLEHRGVFQWLSNRRPGSRGYVMVSATNPQDVRLVQKVNGRDIYIKYQLNGFLFDYLPRYLYAKGFINVGLTDYSFEVDDELNPYWIVTLYKNKIGYSGPDAVGVAVINAQTGEISRYDLNNMPGWIDRTQPEDFVYRQISDWGAYINGFWNVIFAKTGTLRPTGDELHLIYGNDDSVYWYTGLTSSGKDESTVGFLLVNSRTKEAKWYKVSGANEIGATKSAEGQVQEKSYRAGYPILYNIDGVPTYISPLKDKEGLLKAVAFISVENYNIVGVGPDLESAARTYRQNILSKGNLFIPGNEVRQNKIEGQISRISYVVKGGESYYYFMLTGDPRIFIASGNISAKLPLARPGDKVSLVINDNSAATVSINEFSGLSY